MPAHGPAKVTRALVVVSLLGLASSTTPVSAAPGDCTTAAALVERGLPQRAVALLDGLPATECTKERSSAASAVQLAAELATKAEAELQVADYPSARAWATEALVKDKENARATTTVSAVEQRDSWSARVRSGWDGFWGRHVTPSAALLALLLAVLAALVVLARLVALGRADWLEPGSTPNAWRGWMRVGAVAGLLGGAVMVTVGLSNVLSDGVDPGLLWAGRTLAFVTGVVALVVGGASRRGWHEAWKSLTLWVGLVILAGLGADQAFGILEGSARWRTPLWVVLAVLTAGVGTWLTAWLLATRLRLDVVVKGEDGAVSSTGVGTVVALLSELGAERARGIEVPRGADVTALEGAFATLPDNAFLKAVKGIFVSIGGMTPWTATVEGGPASRSVSIRRNGREVDSAVIDVASIVPPLEPADAAGSDGAKEGTTQSPAVEPDASLRLAAAFILTTLAKKHRAIRSGLAQATRWESVGLQYIASADVSETSDPGRRRALLAAALNRDPANLSAQLAYRHALDRQSTDKETLRRYREWLSEFEKEQGLTPGLKLRATYTRAVIATNEAFAGGSSAGALQPVRDALEAHKEAAAEVTKDGPEAFLVREFEDRLSGLHYLANRGQRPSPRSPGGMYNLGCALASRHDVVLPLMSPGNGGKARDDAEAVVWLRRANEDPLDRDWYKKDPQLAEFRTRAFFRRAFLAAPNADFFAVPTVADVAENLRKAGYVHPRLLVGARASVVASATQIERARAGVVIRLAEVHRSLVDHPGTPAPGGDAEATRPLKAWAGELLPLFADEGRPSLAELGSLPDAAARRAFAKDIATRAHAAARDDDELPELQTGAGWPAAYLAAPVESLKRLEGALDDWLAAVQSSTG